MDQASDESSFLFGVFDHGQPYEAYSLVDASLFSNFRLQITNSSFYF